MDNEAALGSLVSGRSGSDVTRAVVELTADWEYLHCPGIWYERVASHSNPADAPSRLAFENLPPEVRAVPNLDDLIDSVHKVMQCDP